MARSRPGGGQRQPHPRPLDHRARSQAALLLEPQPRGVRRLVQPAARGGALAFLLPPSASAAGNDSRRVERRFGLEKLFYEHGVDLYLCGHQHNSERCVVDGVGGCWRASLSTASRDQSLAYHHKSPTRRHYDVAFGESTQTTVDPPATTFIVTGAGGNREGACVRACVRACVNVHTLTGKAGNGMCSNVGSIQSTARQHLKPNRHHALHNRRPAARGRPRPRVGLLGAGDPQRDAPLL